MLLIAYDGSEDAKAAIRHAGELMPNTTATVLTIWEPFATMLDRTPAVLRPLAQPDKAGQIDREESDAARASADEAAELAGQAGLVATPLTTKLNGTVADTIIGQANQLDVDAIVVGSRGLAGVQMLLGSVSLAVVQRANRAVIIVPSADVAAQRQAEIAS